MSGYIPGSHFYEGTAALTRIFREEKQDEGGGQALGDHGGDGRAADTESEGKIKSGSSTRFVPAPIATDNMPMLE